MTEKTKKDRKKVEAAVRQKVDCEEKAFRWVEHLALVDKISEEELGKMMSEVMLCHYADVTEERALSKVCGYPLCGVKLGKRTSQKYCISTKQNKVIDLSVRGNFCSLYCYQASRYIEQQIPQDPIWMRSGKPVEVKLLEKKLLSDVGEIPLKLSALDLGDGKEDEEESEDEDYSYGLEEEQKKSTKQKNNNVSSLFQCVESESEEEEEEDEKPVIIQKKKPTPSPKQIKLIDTQEVIRNKNTVSQQYISKIVDTMKEWFTKKSFQFLNILNNNYSDSDDEPEDFENDINAAKLFPETAEFQNKVMNFLSRQPEWVSETVINDDDDDDSGGTKKSKKLLPTVDSRSQYSIRRRIVHEKLNSCLRQVLPLCGLLEEDLNEVGFFKLVDTFNFTSKNIVLNLKEWLVLTLILLRLISKRYQKDFGSMKTRHQDINDFLVMRALPNITYIDEVIDTICREEDEKVRVKMLAEETSSNTVDYYYDNMEEVD